MQTRNEGEERLALYVAMECCKVFAFPSSAVLNPASVMNNSNFRLLFLHPIICENVWKV